MSWPDVAWVHAGRHGADIAIRYHYYQASISTTGSNDPSGYQPRSQADGTTPASHGGVSADQPNGGPGMESRHQADGGS
jgi:hypothetical protein